MTFDEKSMKTTFTILLAGTIVLIVSVGVLFGLIYSFPQVIEEYYSPVFRSNSFNTDWLFYLHPFVLSAALFWFWNRLTGLYVGSGFIRAIKVSLIYGLFAMTPVLLLTFSAIDISVFMVITWLVYGILQALLACLIFEWRG
jgi:hypothetical protein